MVRKESLKRSGNHRNMSSITSTNSGNNIEMLRTESEVTASFPTTDVKFSGHFGDNQNNQVLSAEEQRVRVE